MNIGGQWKIIYNGKWWEWSMVDNEQWLKMNNGGQLTIFKNVQQLKMDNIGQLTMVDNGRQLTKGDTAQW